LKGGVFLSFKIDDINYLIELIFKLRDTIYMSEIFWRDKKEDISEISSTIKFMKSEFIYLNREVNSIKANQELILKELKRLNKSSKSNKLLKMLGR